MASLDFREKVKYNVDNVIHGNPEAMLGRTLLEPFGSMNSGSRKLMHSKEREQVLPLMNGEKANVESGYEIRFGDLSSSIVEMEEDSVLLTKIPKFSDNPGHHYFSIFGSTSRKILYVKERRSYTYVTEEYGWMNNNTTMDSLRPGDYVSKGTQLRKSLAFDEYNNRKDGLNLNTVYMALSQVYEDSLLVSDETAYRYTSPLIHILEMTIPLNFIPLNLHGGQDEYKVLPDIGESLDANVLAGFRTEVKEDMLYSQTKERLQNFTMSDELYTICGKNLTVVDMDVYCNNPENIEKSRYLKQLNKYHQDRLRFARELTEFVSYYITLGYSLEHDLEVLYGVCKRVLEGKSYTDKHSFTDLKVFVTVLEERPLDLGDKLADRNGGKGVVSAIVPVEFMPMLPDGTRADIVVVTSTMYGRENPAQCVEVSLTHVGREILNYIENNNIKPDDALKMIVDYLKYVVPEQSEALQEYLSGISYDDRLFYLDTVMKRKKISISNKPISESYDIDKLNELYKHFPQIGQTEIYVPLMDSNGNYRMVKARRKTVVGDRYTLRLKQFAQDKFSGTSLSSTNLRNENVKSKAASNYKSPHSRTCNRLGYQEAYELLHGGAEMVASILNIYSTMPTSRRKAIKLLTEDPFNTDLKMDPDGVNRNAEITATYMKTIGLRMNFIKKIKTLVHDAYMHCVSFTKRPKDIGKDECVKFNNMPGYDFGKAYLERLNNSYELSERCKAGAMEYPVRFKILPRDVENKD